jgi:uncharacterized protein YyaL (SSP411 family)
MRSVIIETVPNHLAVEQSPYLLQHKDNPVDWYPWGQEAFDRARSEEKPIFLSVGYSTCHWCHVMEHESFENADVAAVLNRDFVSIKVDREERPDVDRVYMTFVQSTTGAGGWPMSVWLTPALEPFYGGTYFPPTSRWGRPGFIDILQEIARVWHAEREKVLQSASSIVGRLRTMRSEGGGPQPPGVEVLQRAAQEFAAAFDARRGGFGDAPKFPRPSELLFLLREHARTGQAEPRDMALVTLRAMALGGMRDHIGGGFHRYSVDGDWRVPHFEKMLYDQAQLVLAYVEASQVTGDLVYLDVALDTLEYVRRDLTDTGGAFYSAEDADSVPPEQAGERSPHKMEGAFYVWRDAEVAEALGGDADIFRQRFGVLPGGNAPSDPQAEFTGKNLLYTAHAIEQIAGEAGRPIDEVQEALERSRSVLFARREARPRPHLDDKVLTAWNGLMIAAFARGSRMLSFDVPTDTTTLHARYLAGARRAATFVKEQLWDASAGTLLRRHRQGQSGVDAYAEDYAYLVFGLLELFQADGDPEWLEWALALQQQQDALFWDPADGGWFSTTGNDPSVLLRLKEDHDGAEPAASSVSVMNLLMLSRLVGDDASSAVRRYAERIERTLGLFGARASQFGRAVPMMLAALSTYHAGVSQLVIVGDPDEKETRAMTHEANQRYLPAMVTVPVVPRHRDRLAHALPWIAAMHPRGGAPTAYLCRDFACQMPATSAGMLRDQLRALQGADRDLHGHSA